MDTFKPPFPQGGYGMPRRRRPYRRQRTTYVRRRRQRGRGVGEALGLLKRGVKSPVGRAAISAICSAAQRYAASG